jgi:hypothetical protein
MSKQKTLEDLPDVAPINTPEQVEAQENLDNSVTLDFSSKADSGGTEFLPLEEDVFYEFSVEKAEVRERPVYDNPTEMEKVIMVQFIVEGRTDGKDIKDVEGTVQGPGTRKIWEWLSTTATGFAGSGKPSRTRMCIYSLLNKDLEEEFKGVKTGELLEKGCKAMLEIKTKKDGTKINKVFKYSPL